ncbi:hypothetical protein Lfu02_02520 [Longispora fulva]|uniref:Uncharacterized protein n=1 Tax=Longispora fulva TaxID=619741 RepID=A0A8J7KJU7_9ACTN|nr:hypothetical protein [Longispora fulva]MBG6135876.1 hypothetical protein [Longispora fulva]GIG55880.1 hypothetical protein Lfu02_02520 [Longispora fulva]
MSSGKADLDFGAVQQMINSTDSAQQEQNDASHGHDQRNQTTIEGGLAGQVLGAARDRGVERQSDWSSVSAGNNRALVDNFHQALGAYSQGQDDAVRTANAISYGTGSAINPT